MFQGWRVRLREAETALDQGRLEEAGRMLAEGDLQKFLPGRLLSGKVAQRLAERARQRVLQGDFAAGWRDLEHSRQVGGESQDFLVARQELTELVLGEAEGHLRAGDASRALGVLSELDRDEPQCESWRLLRDVCRHVESARHLCRRGKFLEADAQLQAAAALRPDLLVLAARRAEYRQLHERSRDIYQRLHQALAAASWSEALSAADRLLELAPEDRLARNARKRAWAEVGTRLVDSQPTAYPSAWTSAAGELAAVCESACESAATLVGPAVGQRFLLWVDAVGGYLVCLADQVVLGQAVPGSTIDIPILADLSRQHARICRVGDGYVIEPLAAVRVAGKRIQQRTLLGDGDELELGSSVRLRFRQPHPLSATARLEFLSRHRSQPSADGVLLMAESCVLGPGWRNHVICREWQDDVVLYRQDGELYCRCMEPIEIDGQLCDGKGRVPRNARICGEKFAMGLEAV